MFDDALLKTIWNYLTIDTLLLPADAIVVGGSSDLGVASYASDLFKQGYAPIIVFSGYKEPGLEDTEANLFAQVARQKGVPESAIIREAEATNTGDNIIYSERLLKERGIDVRKVILVHKPYMSRRFLATAEVQWSEPRPEFMIAHQDITIDNYYLKLGRGEVIRTMLGDFNRMKKYAKKGYQSPQVIPDDVQSAYDQLVERGHQVR